MKKQSSVQEVRQARKEPKAITVFWSPLRPEKGLASYDHETGRLTFNTDVPMMRELRSSQNAAGLACIAAAHIASDIEGFDHKMERFGFVEDTFAHMFSKMMERISGDPKKWPEILSQHHRRDDR